MEKTLNLIEEAALIILLGLGIGLPFYFIFWLF